MPRDPLGSANTVHLSGNSEVINGNNKLEIKIEISSYLERSNETEIFTFWS